MYFKKIIFPIFFMLFTTLISCKKTEKDFDDFSKKKLYSKQISKSDQNLKKIKKEKESKIKKTEKISLSKINIKLGLAYLEQNMIQRAKLKLNNALQLSPKMPEAHSAMAYFQEKVGEKEEAMKHHKLSLIYSKNDVACLNNYASFLCNQKQFKKAFFYFDKALLDKNYINISSVFENAGICAYNAKLFKKAKFYLQKALQHDFKKIKAKIFLEKIVID